MRILATTDLHGHILGFNYAEDCDAPGSGLAGLATLISAARAEAQSGCVLLDNGDFLQGTALAEHLAQAAASQTHTIAAAFNLLQYDAIGIGNHDFDFGLPHLKSFARKLNMPAVCSNLYGCQLDPIVASALSKHTVHPINGAGTAQDINIGYLSYLPRQTTTWNHYDLGPSVWIENTTKRVADQATKLRARGADLIIALAHMGPGQLSIAPQDTEGGIALAQTGAVDVIIAGHTHLRLPGPDYADRIGVDAKAGAMACVPTLMAGHAGSDLGVLDLELAQDSAGKWQIKSHHAELRANTAQTVPHAGIVALTDQAHSNVRAKLSEQIATAVQDIHSYFALASPACTTRRMAAAQMHLIEHEMSKGSFAKLPLLSAAPAQLSGGREGPNHYFHIRKGPILRRQIAALSPYTNRVVGLRVTGREISDWLEHAATTFARLSPNCPDQPLLNQQVPAFHFDTIFGIDYAFDLSAPPGDRVRDLRWNGQLIAEEQPFAIATTLFRAAGGGGYMNFTSDRVLCQSSEPLEEALIEVSNSCKHGLWAGHKPWRFRPLVDTQAVLLTAPAAADHLDDIAHLSPQTCGQTTDGFLRLRLTL